MSEVRVLSSCTCCPNEPSGFCEMPGCECPCCVMGYADALSEDVVKAEARAARAEAWARRWKHVARWWRRGWRECKDIQLAAFATAGNQSAARHNAEAESCALRAAVAVLARAASAFEAGLSEYCDGPERDALTKALADPAVRRVLGETEGVGDGS